MSDNASGRDAAAGPGPSAVGTAPRLAELPPELREIQQRWRGLPRAEQDELHARCFAEPFARLFAKLPLHGAPADLPPPRGLVSVLGLSWQPVALMAARFRPERMLVLGTEDSLKLAPGGEGVLSLIARIAAIDRDAIQSVRVGDPGEADIYRAVRDFLRRSGLEGKSVYVDPTGGKKSMSASAALAGFLEGAPLVYVDYGEYSGPARIPVAGTEYPRLLANPLAVLGDLELGAVFSAFARSDFGEAERLATRLAARLYEPREAECLAHLARGHGAWDRFELAEAHASLTQARDGLERFGTQGGWGWAAEVLEALGRNLPALEELKATTRQPATLAEGEPLLAWYLAAARRLLGAGKASLAVLLTYAAVERFVHLCLWVDHGLEATSPDYPAVAGRLDDALYERAGKALFGRGYERRPLEGPLMFANGAQLLAALAPSRLPLEDLGHLQGLANARNRCEYEHGFLPVVPRPDEVDRFHQRVRALIARASDEPGRFEERLQRMEIARFGGGG